MIRLVLLLLSLTLLSINAPCSDTLELEASKFRQGCKVAMLSMKHGLNFSEIDTHCTKLSQVYYPALTFPASSEILLTDRALTKEK